MFKLEDAPDCYLFVKPGVSSWHISSDQKSENSYLKSQSAGQECPAHPRNTLSTISSLLKGWMFNNNNDENAKEDWEMEGGFSILCTTHDDKWLVQQAMEGSWDEKTQQALVDYICLLYTSPSPRDF